MGTIYFDNSATTPLCDAAKTAIIEAADIYGNPSSLHAMGVAAEGLISDARRAVLTSLGIRGVTKLTEKQLIFTASGTEADNLALFGAIAAKKYNGKKILISDSEHAAIMESAAELERRGHNVVRIPTVGGVPDYAMIEREADRNTVLASFMLVNNETGALYDIRRIASIVKAANTNAIVHTDCVQGYMNVPFTDRSLGADMISVSAHKIGGPKGVGALYVSAEMLKKRSIAPIIHGGGQETGMRSGTENLLGIVGFGAAVRHGMQNRERHIASCREIRDFLIEKLSGDGALGGVKLNLPPVAAPHILSITLPGIKSETMLHRLSLDGIFVSSGSACSSNTGHKSHVLRAFGLSEREADCTIRVSLGKQNTLDEAKRFLVAFENALATLVRI